MIEELIRNSVDEHIMNFCIKISEKYNINKWCLFASYKFGEFDKTYDIIENVNLENKVELLIKTDNGEIIARIDVDKWEIIPV